MAPHSPAKLASLGLDSWTLPPRLASVGSTSPRYVPKAAVPCPVVSPATQYPAASASPVTSASLGVTSQSNFVRSDPIRAATPWCETGCQTSALWLVVGYIVVISVGAFISAVFPLAGLPLLALAPPIFIVGYFVHFVYYPQTLPWQAVFSALEAIGLMLPLVCIILPLSTLARVGTGAEENEGMSLASLLASFVTAFLFAAIPEELLKFLSVWHLAPSVVDPRGLVVYAMAAAAGFAAVENFLYVVLSQQMGIGILRAAVSVPGHIATGAIIGSRLAKERFVDEDPRFDASQWKQCPPLHEMVNNLLVPVSLHGSFNFLLYTAGSVDPLLGLALFCLVVSVNIVAVYIAREHARHLMSVTPQDVRMLVDSGAAPRPQLRCCLGICCACFGGAPMKTPSVIGEPIRV